MQLKTAERNYYESKFSDPSSSSSSIWKTAYSALGSYRTSFPTQILHAGKLISNPTEMATEVNKFFVDKISQLKQQFPYDVSSNPLTELKNYLLKTNLPPGGFKLHEVNEQEIKSIIKGLKGKKSCVLDWICGYSLKTASTELQEELKALINISIRSNTFVRKWKATKVLPGWKNKGTRFELKFYRPISNLSEVSKLVEKAVHNQLYEYLHENGLLHPNHHGFLRNCSTATALQHLFDLWLQHLDKGKLVGGLFLDLSAGFDVINHSILLKKMKEYNFQDSTIKWFSSYLLDRSQCVQIESSFSAFLPVPWGVPQGSILGPLLFILFINELPEVIANDNIDEEIGDDQIIVYSDDNTPTTADEDPICLQAKIQHEADVVTAWFARNDMICSGDKTKLLIVGTQTGRKNKLTEKNISINVNVCGDVKKESNSEKLLGVVVNNIGTWRHHIHGDEDNQGLLKQLSTRVNMLKRLRRVMSPRKLKMLMAGLFTSKLIYCITVWGRIWNIPGSLDEEKRTSSSMTKEDLRQLQVMQNKCLRLISNSRYDTPTLSLLQKTNLLSVHQLTAHLTLTQVYNSKNTMQPNYHYRRLFERDEPEAGARTRTFVREEIKRPDFNLSLARSNFFYQASRLWSALPETIKLSSNKGVFKNRNKVWIKLNISAKP